MPDKRSANIVNETLCLHDDKTHAVRDFMAERAATGALVRVGPRTYCGEEVGLCDVWLVTREPDEPTQISCGTCVDAIYERVGAEAAEKTYGLRKGECQKKRTRRASAKKKKKVAKKKAGRRRKR